MTIALLSRNCFKSAIVQDKDVNVEHDISEVCSLIDINSDSCISYVSSQSETSYSPPFLYSYRCSSELLVGFAPVLIFVGFLNLSIPILIASSRLLRENITSSSDESKNKLIDYLLEKVEYLSVVYRKDASDNMSDLKTKIPKIVKIKHLIIILTLDLGM